MALEPTIVASRHGPTAGSTLHGPAVGTTVHLHRFATKTASHETMALLPHHFTAGSSNPSRGLVTGFEARHHSCLIAVTNFGSILEQIHWFSHLPLHSTYALMYNFNETLAHVQLGSTQFAPSNP